MLPLPETIIALLTPFAPLFSRPVWSHVQVLLLGAILCRGPRTVASVLRVMGLGAESGFGKYHRVLSRARWSGLQGAKIVLGLLITLLPPGWPVLIGVDETIERRGGRKIKAKGCYRDAVRSSKKVVVKCYGLKWISVMVLVPLPWSSRVWALPFLTVLAPSKRANEQAGRRHKTVIDWTLQGVKLLNRWLKRPWVLIGDGGYACVRLALACARSSVPVTLISRLRLDAQLYAFPTPPPPGRRGPKPKKGQRLTALSQRLGEVLAHGKDVTVRWYGGQRKTVRILSGTCLWHTSGWPPVAIRWVLVVDLAKPDRAEAFFSTDVDLKPEQIIEWFVLRWSVEVTFEESRRHLGVETQRQWSDFAIARTTPALLSVFSLVCWLAYQLREHQPVTIRTSAWYLKPEATFSDILAQVRRVIWAEKYFNNSAKNDRFVVIPRHDWESLIDQLAEAA
jgi:hypothetical protein